MLIGRGIFQWDSIERQTDRYGTFSLCAHDEDSSTVVNTGEKVVHSPWVADDAKAFLDTEAVQGFIGSYVILTAKVLVTRKSRHLGDRQRKIKPTRPEVGEVIEIGRGELFIEPSRWEPGTNCGDLYVGLLPDDGRDRAWLDPVKLYRLHTQTVEITAELAKEPKNRIRPQAMDLSDVKLAMEPVGADVAGRHYMQIKRL
jgi:hypothetical protein